MNGAMLGQTFGVIVAQQFANLRDGDRYWFENQGFDRATLNQIKQTTLSDLILRNTDTVNMQDDAFVYYERHTGLAGGIAAENPDAPQLIIGSDGIDTLIGGIANDILVAGSQGLQTLTGGRGADLFIFEKANTSALITDFRVGQDQIEIQSANRLGFNDLHIMRSPNGNGTMIEFAGNQVTLTGINLNDLRPGDFIFTS
jgi:Ca2+-binding RTX toxin-like protein